MGCFDVTLMLLVVKTTMTLRNISGRGLKGYVPQNIRNNPKLIRPEFNSLKLTHENLSKKKVVTIHFDSYFEFQRGKLAPETSPSDFYQLPRYTEP